MGDNEKLGVTIHLRDADVVDGLKPLEVKLRQGPHPYPWSYA